MKKLLLLSALAFTLSCSNSEKNEESESEKEDQEETSQNESKSSKEYLANEEASLTINGMSCEINCVSSVKKAVKKMDGVTDISIDFDSEREGDFCKVKYDNNVLNAQSIQSVIEAVNDGAYKVTESTVSEIDEKEEKSKNSKATAYNFSRSTSSVSTSTSTTVFGIPSILDFVVALF